MDLGINSKVKNYRMLSFLFVGFVGKGPPKEKKIFFKKGLISGYFLFVPIYSRLFHLINFFPH